jgi:hypothetical protein
VREFRLLLTLPFASLLRAFPPVLAKSISGALD